MNDLQSVTGKLLEIAGQLPSNQAGSRFKRLLTKGKAGKTHHFFVLAGPLGAITVASMTQMPEAQRLTYMRMFQACGDLWAKELHGADVFSVQHAVIECICLMELHLPASEADVKLHDLLHLAFDVIPAFGKQVQRMNE